MGEEELKRFKISLKLKIILGILFISGTLIAIAFPLLFSSFDRAVLDDVREDLDVISFFQKNRIQDEIEKSFERLKGITSRTQLRLSLKNYLELSDSEEKIRISKILGDALLSIKDFRNIHVLDTSGVVLASTDKGLEGKILSQENYFKEGIIKDSFNFDEEKELIYLSGPLIFEDTILGAAVIELSNEKFKEIISNYSMLGETGETILGRRNRDGTISFLFQRRFEIFDSSGNKTYLPGVSMNYALSKQEDFFEEILDYRGVSVVSYTRHIPEVNWGLVVKKDREEAFKPLIDLRSTIFFIFIAVAVLSALLIIFLSNQIFVPIKKITQANKSLGKGDYSVRVKIKSGDELQELGESFNNAAEALGKLDEERKQLDKSKTEFLSITSHELRSPMTPMIAQMQMLKEGYFGKLGKEKEESLDIIYRNTLRLDSLIQDILEISRIEAARLKFNFVLKKVEDVVKQTVDEMNNFLPEKNIQIIANIDKIPEMELDPDRLMQVLINLVNNAKKFSEKNSKIFISAKIKNDMIEFKVQDQGAGISKEGQKRIFEPFYQELKPMSKKYEGTGLGLAICRGIVEAQNGRIWVESETGKGSTFYFTLPLIPVKEIKPIRILFSPQMEIERKILDLFKEFLGPLGEQEFSVLKKEKKLELKNLISYLDELYAKQILSQTKLEVFKKKIKEIMVEKEKEANK